MINSVDGLQDLAHRGRGVRLHAGIRGRHPDAAGLPARTGRRILVYHRPFGRAVIGLRAARPAPGGKDRRSKGSAHRSPAWNGVLRDGGCVGVPAVAVLKYYFGEPTLPLPFN